MFTDVPKDLNSYEAIKNLKDAGWVVGVGDNEYKPFDTVTRAQMAVFICRARNGTHYKPPAIPFPQYPDVPMDYWGANWISAAGMDEYADGKFHPRNPATLQPAPISGQGYCSISSSVKSNFGSGTSTML